jgi:hypothetical protein
MTALGVVVCHNSVAPPALQKLYVNFNFVFRPVNQIGSRRITNGRDFSDLYDSDDKDEVVSTLRMSRADASNRTANSTEGFQRVL